MSEPEDIVPATSMPDPDWCTALWPHPEAVLQRLGFDRAANVVDLCCGDGLFTVPLARMAGRVAAIDLGPATPTISPRCCLIRWTRCCWGTRFTACPSRPASPAPSPPS